MLWRVLATVNTVLVLFKSFSINSSEWHKALQCAKMPGRRDGKDGSPSFSFFLFSLRFFNAYTPSSSHRYFVVHYVELLTKLTKYHTFAERDHLLSVALNWSMINYHIARMYVSSRSHQYRWYCFGLLTTCLLVCSQAPKTTTWSFQNRFVIVINEPGLSPRQRE